MALRFCQSDLLIGCEIDFAEGTFPKILIFENLGGLFEFDFLVFQILKMVLESESKFIGWSVFLILTLCLPIVEIFTVDQNSN